MNNILMEVEEELNKACAKFPGFHSEHEGYAVILEEVDELWEMVKLKPENRDKELMKREAIQIAAMSLRFIKDLC